MRLLSPFPITRLQQKPMNDPIRYAVDTQQGFENVLVLDNVPIVDESKKQRLIDRLRQVFEKAGAAIEENRVNMPWDDKAGMNKG